jgi:uncharacterized protein (DUF1499 family)
LILILLVTIVGGILFNALPLTDPPGISARIRAYLTTNQAKTAEDSDFPELRPRSYNVPPKRLFELVQSACYQLEWTVMSQDPASLRIHAVAQTSLLGFKDDVVIQVEAVLNGSVLRIRASSRVGRGDLGANTRHVLDLYKALDDAA